MIFWHLSSFFLFADKSAMVAWNMSLILWYLSLRKVETILVVVFGRMTVRLLRHIKSLQLPPCLVHSLWGKPATKQEDSELAPTERSTWPKTSANNEHQLLVPGVSQLEADPPAPWGLGITVMLADILKKPLERSWDRTTHPPKLLSNSRPTETVRHCTC